MATEQDDPSSDVESTGWWHRFTAFLTTLTGALIAITGLLAAITALLTFLFNGGGGTATSSTERTSPADPSTIACSPSGPMPVPTPFGRVTITCPPYDKVQRCWKFRGDARLRAGTALVIGERRVDPPDKTTYFHGVTWTGEVGQSRWSVSRHFGTEVGHTYRVFVIAITRKALDDVLRARGSDVDVWTDSTLPRVDAAAVSLAPDVRQIPGPGNCDPAQ